MEFSRITSTGKPKNFFIISIKVMLIVVAISAAIILLNKIDFPSPNKEIEKIITNENIKVVK